MNVYGDIVLQNYNERTDLIQNIIETLSMPVIKPRYRVSILNPDETVNYIIPNQDILADGIAYTEEYQNGQRRNVTLKLVNKDGKYTPSINGIWLNTKFSLEIGIIIKKEIIWFPKGVFIMGDITLENNINTDTITIQLKDKYAIFEGKMGTLQDPYEVEIGSNIEEALQGIMNFDRGDGYIYDYKKIIFDPSFTGAKTQAVIRVEEGGTIGEVIKSLAIQLSAEYYYNNIGNLCFYPINETIDDSNKPIIWTFNKLKTNTGGLSLNYKNEDVINIVKVVGDNIDGDIYSAIAENDNPASPICIQQVGKRVSSKRSEPNIWNDVLASDLARYYLRQASFIAIDFSTMVSFNPILTVNNLCEVENDFLSFHREKLLITSISFNSSDGQMSLKMCNTKELPFI